MPGEDTAAQAIVRRLVDAGAMRAFDIDTLSSARTREAFQFLFTSGFNSRWNRLHELGKNFSPDQIPGD